MNYLVAAIGEWNKALFDLNSKGLDDKWHYVSTPDELNEKLATGLKPRYIFFPHWRWIVPEEILNRFECVCFHMTDVPFGRGGSPLQNLIVRGHKETVLTALQMEKGLDTGPVYMKEPLCLEGKAEEIYQQAAELTWKMINVIVRDEPVPLPQNGKIVNFCRRKPEQSEIPLNLLSLEQIYDYIRMLDAPGYPKAFIKSAEFEFEFEDAVLKGNEIFAKVRIKNKD